MKRLLCCLLLAEICYAKPAKKPTPPVQTNFDYTCEDGRRKNDVTYRIAYKDEEGNPPCKVVELRKGKKPKRLLLSQKDSSVCDALLDKLLNKKSREGFECFEEENEWTQ
jgi:hypothetical protein